MPSAPHSPDLFLTTSNSGSSAAVDRWELALALLVGAGLAGGCYLYSVYSADPSSSFLATRRRRPAAALVSLRVLQARELAPGVRGKLVAPERWVALCGTVFDVSGDPFFDPRTRGVYALWTGHDATHLLLEMGVNMGHADDEKSMARLLDVDTPFDLVDTIGPLRGEDEREVTRRQQRLDILREWVDRFHTRYPVVAQLSDLYVGDQWDKLREELSPSMEEGQSRPAGKCPMGFGLNSGSSASPHGQRQGGGKCPLGFGSRSVARVVSGGSDSKRRRTIVFQGTMYDVTDSPIFQEGGELAHFVGHDVTYALATQSNSVDDLDVGAPPQGYSYEQQVTLERYRVTFNREFPAVEGGGSKAAQGSEASRDAASAVDLHALIEQIDGGGDESLVSKTVEAIRSAILLNQVADIDSICVRTSMTALHKAVEKNQLELVRVLVEGGADLRAEAALYDNETPLEMARRFRFDQVVDYLSTQVEGTQ